MPKLIDPLYMKIGSTDVLLASTDGKLFGSITAPVGTTEAQTLVNKTFGAGTGFNVQTGSTTASLLNYGLSILAGSSTGAPNVYTLAAPFAGTRKTIYCLTASSSDTVTVSATTSVAIGDIATTNAYRKIVFGSPGIVDLIGLTTARWGVLSVGTTYTGSTSLPAFTT